MAAPKLLGDATDVVVAAAVGGAFHDEKLAALLLAVSLMYLGDLALQLDPGRR